MLTYLRTQALTANQNLSASMVAHGRYTYTPVAHLRQDLPPEAPSALRQAQLAYLAAQEDASLHDIRVLHSTLPPWAPCPNVEDKLHESYISDS